jgi:ABC-type Fe3+ transport system permease subunit
VITVCALGFYLYSIFIRNKAYVAIVEEFNRLNYNTPKQKFICWITLMVLIIAPLLLTVFIKGISKYDIPWK